MTDRELMTMTRDALFLANTKHWTTNQIGEAINALNARLSAPDREWVSLTDHEVWEAIEVLEDASAEMLMETGDKNYYIEAIAVLRQALVDADDTSQERVDEIVKLLRWVEKEMRYAGWDIRLNDQHGRTDVYEAIKEFLA
jgi:hypothetical protein